MDEDRQSIDSSSELLRRVVAIFPDFAVQWDDPQNLSLEDDGSFTYCGVFVELSHFVRDRFERIPLESLQKLGRLLEHCMNEPHAALHVAAATCFLENMTFERFSNEFKTHLSGEPLKFFSQFFCD